MSTPAEPAERGQDRLAGLPRFPDNPWERLDLYLPEDRKADKLPVIIFIHGGGWEHDDRSTGPGRLMPCLGTGQ